jgi:hypothetical protein
MGFFYHTPFSGLTFGSGEMMRKILIVMTVVAGLLVASMPVSAHAHATVVEVNGNRCYILSQALTGQVEYWIETNGVITGGEAMGPPQVGGIGGLPFWDAFELLFNALGIKPGDVDPALQDSESGLQRGWFGSIPPDTKVSEGEWIEHCLL